MSQAELDFSAYISERTRDFTGREWVFEAVNDWLVNHEGPRHFLITGKPGSGKTAIVSRLTQFSQGEILPPDGLSQLILDFLSAAHFCSARDRRWINPYAFAESLAIQLAGRYPAYAKALAEKSGDRQVRIEVEQQIQEVVGGQVVGVVIKSLDVSGVSPEDAFIRVVREPLEALFREGFDERVIILVDALDEALLYSGKVNIISLLSQAEYLPAGVRFILTSRPETEVLRPLRRSGPEECTLTSREGLTHSLDDIKQYVLQTIAERLKLADKLALDLPPDAFAAAVQGKSDGNFLYVNYLLQMLVAQRGKISQGALDKVPKGLDGIYIEFLGRLVEGDEEAWEEKYAPVLGTLAVAQEALTEGQLTSFIGTNKSQVRKVLKSLRQFLDVDESLPASERTYAIYHHSFADFLLDGDRAEEYWCEAAEQHERIVKHYRGLAPTWEDVDWSQVDNYGLFYLATHLYVLRDFEVYRQLLYDLISQAWMRLRYQRSGYTYGGFLGDVELAWQAALPHETENLVPLVRLQTVRQVVSQSVSTYTNNDLQILVWLGREEEALDCARLRHDARDKFQGLLAIHDAFRMINHLNPAVLDETLEIVGSIQNNVVRAEALCHLARALTEIQDSRASAIFNEAEEAARSAQALGQGFGRLENLLVDLSAALTRARLYTQALGVARSIKGYDNKRVRALCNLGVAMAQVGDNRADAVFDEVKRTAYSLEFESFRAEALHDLAVALAQIGRFDQSQEVAGPTSELVAALAQVGCFDRAQKVAYSIQAEETRAVALCDLAAALARVGSSRAYAMFDEARETARLIKRNWQRVEALSSLAVAMAQSGDNRADNIFDEVEEVARSIQDSVELGPGVLRVLALDLARVGRVDRALEVAHSIHPNGSRARVLSDLTTALAYIGCFGTARELALSIEEERVRGESLYSLAVALAQATHFDIALEVARLIEDKELQVEGLRVAAAALAQSGDEQAGLVFDEMRRVADSIQGAQPSEAALRDVAIALAQAGRRSEAREIAHLIQIVDNQTDVLRHLAVILAQAGYTQADEVLDEALKVACSILDTGKRVNALCDLAVALADVENQRVDAVFDKAEEIAGTILQGWERANVLRDLATAFAEAGRYARAWAVIWSIEYDVELAEALRQLAVALARVGHTKTDVVFHEATEKAGAIHHDEPRSEARRDLVAALAEAGRFDKAVGVARTIQFDRHLADALCFFAAALAQAGDKQAEAVFDEAEKLARSIKDGKHRAEAICLLAACLARVGDSRADAIFDAAETEALSLPIDLFRAPVLRNLVAEMVQAGRFDKARRVIRTIQDNKHRAEALYNLAAALAQAGSFAEALTALGPCELDKFLQALAEWAPAFEQIEPGLSVAVLQEATSVAGWVRPDWHKVHELLSNR